MTESLVSLNVKISAEEKRRFVETAKEVGLTPSAAIRAFFSNSVNAAKCRLNSERSPGSISVIPIWSKPESKTEW